MISWKIHVHLDFHIFQHPIPHISCQSLITVLGCNNSGAPKGTCAIVSTTLRCVQIAYWMNIASHVQTGVPAGQAQIQWSTSLYTCDMHEGHQVSGPFCARGECHQPLVVVTLYSRAKKGLYLNKLVFVLPSGEYRVEEHTRFSVFSNPLLLSEFVMSAPHRRKHV